MGFFKSLWNGIKGAVSGLFGDNLLGTIGTAVSVGTSLSSQKRQKAMMDYQDSINDENYERERQDKLADYERTLSDQKELIADERQYNSIGSQMQRARNAGVSPLAALGSSSGNTLTSVSPPSPTDSKSVSPTANNGAQHMNNAISLATSLKELKQKDKALQIEGERAEAENKLKSEQARKTEVERLMLEIEKSTLEETKKAELKGKLADNDIKGVEKALKEQEHQQKEEMFEYNKRESESRTKLNNAQAAKISFEDWYQRTHHRTMSNGMNHVIDTFTDMLWSGHPGAHDKMNGYDVSERISDGIGGIFGVLKNALGYVSDDALLGYARTIFEWLKSRGFKFGKTER